MASAAVQVSVRENFPFTSLLKGALDEMLLEKARIEINETEENVKEGKNKLRKLFLESSLPYSDDEEVLLRFLRARKYRFHESFELYKSFIKAFKTVMKKGYKFDPNGIKKALNSKFLCLFPYRATDGEAIWFAKTGAWMEEGFTLDEVKQLIIFAAFYLLEQPATQVAGVSLIVDAQKLSVKEIPPVLDAARFLFPLLRCVPVRVNKGSVINLSPAFETVSKICSALLPKKIRSKISFHGNNMEELYKEFDKRILPEELGGTMGPMSNEHLIDIVDPTLQKVNEIWRVIDSIESL